MLGSGADVRVHSIRKCAGIDNKQIGREFNIAYICANKEESFSYERLALTTTRIICDLTALTPASHKPS